MILFMFLIGSGKMGGFSRKYFSFKRVLMVLFQQIFHLFNDVMEWKNFSLSRKAFS